MNLFTITADQLLSEIPELHDLKLTVENNSSHKNDAVLDHSMNVLKHMRKNLTLYFVRDKDKRELINDYLDTIMGKLSRRQILLWSALLHDIGKPETIQTINGITQCQNHENVGAEKAKRICNRLGLSVQDINEICFIISNHGSPHILMKNIADEHSRSKQIKDFLVKYDRHFVDLLILGLSDTEGSQLEELDLKQFRFRREMYYSLISKFTQSEDRG